LTSPTTLPLVVLMVLLVVTRPLEERWWKAGRISDRVAAWLIAGRLVVLAAGFGVIVGLAPVEVLVLTGIGLLAAFILEPVAQRRIAAVRDRDRTRTG
jgi:hypothetical protein